eukprot:6134098-Alexandrium_andersonii.AAC.1
MRYFRPGGIRSDVIPCLGVCIIPGPAGDLEGCPGGHSNHAICLLAQAGPNMMRRIRFPNYMLTPLKVDSPSDDDRRARLQDAGAS